MYIIDYTSQVAVGHVGGDDDFTLYILAADGVRTHGRADFRYIVQWNFLDVDKRQMLQSYGLCFGINVRTMLVLR